MLLFLDLKIDKKNHHNHHHSKQLTSSELSTGSSDSDEEDSASRSDDDGLPCTRSKGSAVSKNAQYRSYKMNNDNTVYHIQKGNGKGTQRSSSAVQYRRRIKGSNQNNGCGGGGLQGMAQNGLSNSQQWALGTSECSDSISLRNSIASPPIRSARYEPRRSATISAGTFAAMTGQSNRRR